MFLKIASLLFGLVVVSVLLLGCASAPAKNNPVGQNYDQQANQQTGQQVVNNIANSKDKVGADNCVATTKDITTVEGRQYITCEGRRYCGLQSDPVKKQACLDKNDRQQKCDVMTDNKQRAYCNCDNLLGVSTQEIQNCKDLADQTIQ